MSGHARTCPFLPVLARCVRNARPLRRPDQGAGHRMRKHGRQRSESFLINGDEPFVCRTEDVEGAFPSIARHIATQFRQGGNSGNKNTFNLHAAHSKVCVCG